MVCKREHRYDARLSDLPDSQGGEGRHKCCGCAYEEGYNDGFHNWGRTIDWDKIDDSQAGTGRHKSAEDAYILGYADGAKVRRENPSS